jgi:hypothetical protein
MDGDKQVAVQVVGARRTLKQTAQPRPARDQSDCLVEPCLLERLRDHVSELEVEFVFRHAARTVRAGRSSRVAHINEHPKRRSRATAVVAAVLRYRVFSAHMLPSGAGKQHGHCDKSEKATLLDDMDHNSARAAASQPNRRSVETPHALCTCSLAVVQQS